MSMRCVIWSEEWSCQIASEDFWISENLPGTGSVPAIPLAQIAETAVLKSVHYLRLPDGGEVPDLRTHHLSASFPMFNVNLRNALRPPATFALSFILCFHMPDKNREGLKKKEDAKSGKRPREGLPLLNNP